jgi:hypothetical protein
MNFIKKIRRGFAAAGLALFSVLFTNPALADTIDTAAIVKEVTDTKPAIVAVGAAILGILAIVLAFKLIRRVMG